MATKQIPALPNATTALEADLLLKRDTASGVDQKLALPVLMDRVSSYLKDPVESVYRETGILPTLDLNFSDAASFPLGLSFNRNSVATYFDKDGLLKVADPNVPRVEYDPSTRELKGFLIEEERENLIEYSEDFSINGGLSASTIAINQVIAPDGKLTADKLEETAVSALHYVALYPNSVSDDTDYTISVFFKAAERTQARILVRQKNAQLQGAYIDLNDGSISGVNAGVISVSSQDVDNGWYRLQITVNSSSGGTSPAVFIYTSISNNTNYLGVAGSGIYIWGAQLEEGSFPTSYIPTNGAAVTRNADDASMTGADFSDWYRQGEGTIYQNITYLGEQPYFTFPISIALGGTRLIGIARPTNTTQIRMIISPDVNTTLDTPTLNEESKIAFSYNSVDASGSANGKDVLTDNTITVPTNVDRLLINNPEHCVYIKRFTYWPARLDNTLLQNITR